MSLLKILIQLVLGFFIFFLGVLGYSLYRSDVEDLVVCVTNNESHYIPNSICRYYLFEFRVDEADIEYLQNRSGLAFLFGISDLTEREDLIKLFIHKGMLIDEVSNVDGYPPLHAAVLLNDKPLVDLLLSLGADPMVKDRENNFTAIEFSDYLERLNPNIDRSQIRTTLKSYQ